MLAAMFLRRNRRTVDSTPVKFEPRPLCPPEPRLRRADVAEHRTRVERRRAGLHRRERDRLGRRFFRSGLRECGGCFGGLREGA